MIEIVSNDPRIRDMVVEMTGVRCLPDDPSLGTLRDGVPMGGFLFTNWMGTSVWSHMAGIENRWLTRRLLLAFFDYVFNQLKVDKLICPVPAENERALKMDLRVGLVAEARIAGATPEGDLLFLTMTRAQCRWLANPQGKIGGPNRG